nr:ATP phosphoribosyltransferase regulatory subunit [Roseomonas acroporae]
MPAGLADLLPPDAEREAALVEAMLAVFAGHGYERVRPPLLEFEEGLFAGSGAALAEQTFRLMDPVSQRMMGLRADTTPQVARIAATRLARQSRPLRLCYSGQVLRVRGSQLQPERQLPQAGIELIGGRGPAETVQADAEVALVAAEALDTVGVAPTLDVTLPTLAPALFEAAHLAGPARQRLAHALDRKDAAATAALVAECGRANPIAAPALAPLPALLQAAGLADGALAALEAANLPPAARAIADNAAAVVAAIRARAPGLRVTLDPVEFRGFQYHVGVAFTLYGPGRTGELGRGGRYLSPGDPANTALGRGAGNEPATGMTLYPHAVLRAARPAPLRPRLFLPAGTDPAAARSLRAAGYATVAALSAADTPQSLRCTHVLENGRAVPFGETL